MESVMAIKRKVKYTKVEKVPSGPQEYKGYKVGQEVWCYRFPNKEISFGKIEKIHDQQKSGDIIFNFYCEICGSFRIAKFDDIIEEPTEIMKRKLQKARTRMAGIKL
jgi:hypothetical protein